jgi:hypothetical protein
MTRDAITVSPETPLKEAAELLARHQGLRSSRRRRGEGVARYLDRRSVDVAIESAASTRI